MGTCTTPRDRVLQTLSHEEPEHVAVDFGATRSSGIVVAAYMKLRETLGVSGGRPKLYDLKQWLVEPETPVLRRMHGDIVQLHRYAPTFGIPLSAWKDWTTPDGHEVLVPMGFEPVRLADGGLAVQRDGVTIARMPRGGHWFDLVHHPLADATSPADIDAHRWPGVEVAEVAYLERESARLHRDTNYAISATFGGNIYERGHSDFGFQRFMTLLAADRDLILYYLHKSTEHIIQQLNSWLRAVKDHVHVVQVGDDLGMQTGPQISLTMYRELLKPFHARIYQYIKEHSNLYICLHSCGSIAQFLPDLIEIGVDAINPVQYVAADMDPGRLKREFGRHLVFWGGGCDTQQVLTHGSVNDIVDETKRMIDILSPGGGFVFTQVHNIQANIEPQKVLALYDTAQAHRRRRSSG